MWITKNILVALTFAALLTGCLKTRTQLREDGSDEGEAPAEIKDHRPSGGYVIDELKSEFIQLTGRVDELERQGRSREAGASQSASAEDVKKLENRIVELEKSQTAMSEALGRLAASRPANGTGGRAGAASPGAGAEDNGLIEKARKHYAAAEYPQAVEAASGYINSANSSKPKLEEAFFIRADSYFRQKDYKKSIVDFSRFPEKFQKSKMLPPALLKIGNAFDLLGMRDDAKGFYQELTEKFPKSAEAKQARAKLK